MNIDMNKAADLREKCMEAYYTGGVEAVYALLGSDHPELVDTYCPQCDTDTPLIESGLVLECACCGTSKQFMAVPVPLDNELGWSIVTKYSESGNGWEPVAGYDTCVTKAEAEVAIKELYKIKAGG